MAEIMRVDEKAQNSSNKKTKVLQLVTKILTVLSIAVLIGYCISLMIPIIWMLITSLKDGDYEFTGNPFGLPKKLIFENYATMFKELYMEKSLDDGTKVRWGIGWLAGYSLFYTTAAAFIGTAAQVVCAYVLSKYKFIGSELIYAVGIFVMVTPIVGSSVSAMQLKRALGVYDNMLLFLLTSPSTAFSGMNFLILYGAFKSLPWAYAEAVEIDGGGEFTIFFRVMLPMIVPVAAVIFLLGVFAGWNDYSTFLVWLPSYPNLALAMYNVQNRSSLFGVSMPELMAGFTIIVIPTITLYFLTNKIITSKLTVGGLKG